MKRFLCIVFALGFTTVAESQQKPFAALRELLEQGRVLGGSEVGTKCGTPLVFEAMRRMKDLPSGLRAMVRQTLQRPTSDTSRLSPSGRFRIHYDTTGTHEPRMIAGNPLMPVSGSAEEFVDSVAAVFDHCWSVEIGEMGYGVPPPDDGNGGGDEYDVYIQDLAPDLFGFTSWDGEPQLEGGIHERYATFITIDNDFFPHRTKGLDGLRVTAAHEFHHAIQIGSYGLWPTAPGSGEYRDLYFYELTSVWFEEILYDDVNDYYFDLPRFLQNFKDGAGRSLSFSTYSLANAGYERSLWAQYLDKRFSRTAMRELWEGVRTNPVLESADVMLHSHQSSLRDAFAEFSFWNVYTGARADTIRYYQEGKMFPSLQPNLSTTFNGTSTFIQQEAYPFSAQYYTFAVSGDTVIAAISNVNQEAATSNPSLLSGFRLTLTGIGGGSGAIQKLSNGLTMVFSGLPIDDWRTLYIGAGAAADLKSQAFPFPNPMRLQDAAILTLPVEGSLSGPASVFILTGSFDLVFSGSYQVTDSFGKKVVTVPAKDFSGSVSSGIHFVIVKTQQREYRSKMVFIR